MPDVDKAPLRPQRPEDDNDRFAGRRAGRKRQLNVSGLKTLIVFVAGAITALVSGLTGLGAHVAFAPMLTWMLGFAPEKAQGTAMSFAAWAASAAVVGAIVTGATPPGYAICGIMLVVGAVIGAMLCANVSQRLQTTGGRRVFQTLGIALTMAVVIQVSHASGLFALKPNIEDWHSPFALLLIGLGVGGATQIMGLTSGALLVPALYFLSGLRNGTGNYAAPAVSLSVFVIALASLLPALTYAKRDLVDTVYRAPVIAAGLIGGFCGGWLLTHIQERVVIVLAAVVAMFLCARELSRLASASHQEN